MNILAEQVLSLLHIDEPKLQFRFNQRMEHPKDGLFLFGPYDTKNAGNIRAGVIGTKDGIQKLENWVKKIQSYIEPASSKPNHTAFPGFEAAFGVKWDSKPWAKIQIDETKLRSAITLANRHEAIYSTVQLFVKPIIEHLSEEAERPDVWFVIIPEMVYLWGRSQSVVPLQDRTESSNKMKKSEAKEWINEPSLFEHLNEQAKIFQYKRDFRALLKAELLNKGQVTQIVRETTLEPSSSRSLQDDATVAWNLCSTTFFKAVGQPWKLANVRSGVCYVGLVFKKNNTELQGKNACCAAQMFLNSGEGFVFKGALGPWYSETDHQFHLNKQESFNLIEKVVDAYKKSHNGESPKELFIHGKTRFDDEEWEGFKSAVDSNTNIVGVRIVPASGGALKLYTQNSYPVVRGTAYIVHEHKGYLWTNGFIPRLQTYPGPETPNPLNIEICKGESEIKTVMQDIMGLTKINFNTCKFADGLPVTLKFADAVGDILTAGPLADIPPLPFKHYI